MQPSLMEGFGLTALEPISYGKVPVVSDIPIFKEVLGEAALYFDPNDPKQMATTLKNALQLSDSERNTLTCHGEEVLSRFCGRELKTHWEKTFQSLI